VSRITAELGLPRIRHDSLKKAGVTPSTDSSGSPLAGDAANAAVDKAKQKFHSLLYVP
jgi:hypothetical protein